MLPDHAISIVWLADSSSTASCSSRGLDRCQNEHHRMLPGCAVSVVWITGCSSTASCPSRGLDRGRCEHRRMLPGHSILKWVACCWMKTAINAGCGGRRSPRSWSGRLVSWHPILLPPLPPPPLLHHYPDNRWTLIVPRNAAHSWWIPSHPPTLLRVRVHG